MEENLELTQLIKNANSEFNCINGELEIQTEKLKGVQEKLGIQRSTLEYNWAVLKKLEESTKMEKILKILLSVFLIFSILFSITKYAEFTVTSKHKLPENWNQFKKIFF